MENWQQGIVSGVVFGIVAVFLMLPLKFEDKRTALLGAFSSRFAVGFTIAVALLPVPGWTKGAVLGVLLSLPEAIITKSYIPILVIGIIGGTIIGTLVG
jgi:hypothetical protein